MLQEGQQELRVQTQGDPNLGCLGAPSRLSYGAGVLGEEADFVLQRYPGQDPVVPVPKQTTLWDPLPAPCSPRDPLLGEPCSCLCVRCPRTHG